MLKLLVHYKKINKVVFSNALLFTVKLIKRIG